eukprot:1977186-Rhodomonas_salina.1
MGRVPLQDHVTKKDIRLETRCAASEPETAQRMRRTLPAASSASSSSIPTVSRLAGTIIHCFRTVHVSAHVYTDSIPGVCSNQPAVAVLVASRTCEHTRQGRRLHTECGREGRCYP